jgi:polysaccharide biosynthesis transport protein
MFEAPHQVKSVAAGADGGALGLALLGGLDFPAILSTIWLGKTTILRTTALALVIAVLFVLVAPHRFTAVTQILIDPSDLRAVGAELTPSNQLSDAALLQVESQVRVLTSDSVLRRVVKAEALDRDPAFIHPQSKLRALLKAFGLGGGDGISDPALAALNALRRSLVVRRAERTYVVDVTVTSTDPEKAARLANAVAQAYLAEQTAVRFDAARQVSQSLSARLDELKERLRQAEDRAEAFKARNNLVGSGGQLVNEQQLTELNNQLIVARARTAQARARYEEVQRVQQSPGEIGAFPEAVQSPTITALRSQYAEIMRREAEQQTSLGDRHPAVIEIEAQAQRLKRMIDEEINRIALSARTEYDSARANEETLSRNLDTLKHITIGTNEALVTLRELERDVQANRAIYEAFLVRARETGEQERLDTKNIRVISKADPPLSRSFPPSNTLLAAAALIFGMAAGAGLVLMRATTSSAPPSLRQPFAGTEASQTASAASAVPVLATLPPIDATFGLNAVIEPRSRLASEIGKVLEAVWASHSKGDNPSVLVAACDDEDGAAAVSLGLAATAAQRQRVLLLDADLERRILAAVDADRTDAGLVDVAVGRRQLAEAVVRDRASKINLVAFVAPNSRRDRDIEDDDLKAAFAQTRQFDFVVVAAIDCNRDPSGPFFAGLVDHIVLVARAETGDAAIERLVERFGLDARKIRGAVLTGSRAAA